MPGRGRLIPSINIVVTRRVKPLPYGGILIPALSIIIGILISSIILYALSGVPIEASFLRIGDALASPLTLEAFLILMIVGVALVFSFDAALWNIGAEGQIVFGIIAAGYIGLFTPLVAVPPLAKIAMIALGMVLGAAWAAIAGLLRSYFDIDEVPVTLMMNYIAYFLLDYLVYGPWRGKHVYNYIKTDPLPKDVWFIRISTGVTATLEAAILAAAVYLLSWFILSYTAIGLRLRVLGSNPNALKAAGVNTRLLAVSALAISGAIASIAGVVILAGSAHSIGYPYENLTSNFGYTAILVAWLTMLDIRAVPLSAYIISALYQGGYTMQSLYKLSKATIYVYIGAVLITFTVLRILSEYSVKIVVKR